MLDPAMSPDPPPAAAGQLPAVARAPVVAAALLRSVADGLYVVDRDGRLVFLNPAGHRLLGYEDGELDGRDVHAAVHFQDAAGRPLAHAGCPLLAASWKWTAAWTSRPSSSPSS